MSPVNLPATAAAPARDPNRPWYRHGWVWALIAIPGASVLFGIVMITAALSGPTDLVRDDYYKAGLAINQDLGARERGAALGASVRLEDRGAAGLLLRIDLGPDAPQAASSDTLVAEFQHPTLAERDQRHRMEAVAFGRWAVTLPRFEGVRTLRITPADGDWVIQQQVRAPRSGGDGA